MLCLAFYFRKLDNTYEEFVTILANKELIIIYKRKTNIEQIERVRKSGGTESYQKQDSAKSMIKLNADALYLFQLLQGLYFHNQR